MPTPTPIAVELLEGAGCGVVVGAEIDGETEFAGRVTDGEEDGALELVVDMAKDDEGVVEELPVVDMVVEEDGLIEEPLVVAVVTLEDKTTEELLVAAAMTPIVVTPDGLPGWC